MSKDDEYGALPTDAELKRSRQPGRYRFPTALALRSLGGLGAIGVIQIWIAPRIQYIFSEVGEELPVVSKFTIGLGMNLNRGAFVLVPLLIAAVVLTGMLKDRSGYRTALSHGIPLVLYTMAVLLTAGYLWPIL